MAGRVVMNEADRKIRRGFGRRERVIMERKESVPTTSTLGPGECCLYGGKLYVNDSGTIRSFTAD